jgi:quercetin dioxygenase-like cupin family protein
MSKSLAERDKIHNAGLSPGLSIRTSEGKWVDFGPGVQMQLLRTSAETGQWSGLFKCAAGSVVPRHEHLGSAEYLVLEGRVEVRGGLDEGGMVSIAGDYVYEPNGVIHCANWFVEDSLVFFTSQGAMKFLDEHDNVIFICDWRALRNMESGKKD